MDLLSRDEWEERDVVGLKGVFKPHAPGSKTTKKPSQGGHVLSWIGVKSKDKIQKKFHVLDHSWSWKDFRSYQHFFTNHIKQICSLV